MREHPLDAAREAARDAAVEQGLARLGGLARAAGSQEVPEAWRERVLGALSRESPRPESPRSQTRASLSGEVHSALPGTRARRSAAVRVVASVAACLALVVAVAGAVFRFRPEAPLAYAVDDAPSASSYVRAGPDGAVARFNDGTVISFAPGARGRVVAVTAHGARVSVDEGKAHFAVVHRPGAEWAVEAGPFTVAVTGTEFDVAWVHEHLDLVMHAGTVSVRGPLTPQGVALQAGQHLAVDITRGELTITESSIVPGASATSTTLAPSPDDDGGGLRPLPTPPDPAPDPSTKRSTAPSPSPRLPASAPRPVAAPAPTESQAPAPPSFRDRVARGDFAAVITEAEARGVDVVVDGGSLADVAALADAARYAGKADLARRALLAERSRFVGSPEARSAAFLLGRMAQARLAGSGRRLVRHLPHGVAGGLARPRGAGSEDGRGEGRVGRRRQPPHRRGVPAALPPRRLRRSRPRDPRRPMTARQAALVGVLLCAMLVAPRALHARDGSTVTLVSPPHAGALVEEAVIRLTAELRAAGFSVRLVEAPADGDGRTQVEGERGVRPGIGPGESFATIALVTTDHGTVTDLWVADHVTRKTLVRRIDVGDLGATNAASDLAVRTVELLQASLLEVSATRKQSLPPELRRPGSRRRSPPRPALPTRASRPPSACSPARPSGSPPSRSSAWPSSSPRACPSGRSSRRRSPPPR